MAERSQNKKTKIIFSFRLHQTKSQNHKRAQNDVSRILKQSKSGNKGIKRERIDKLYI